MTTSQATINFILDQIKSATDVRARRMFGEFAINCGGKTVALVCDDQLFVKPTKAGRAFMAEITQGRPFPGAKPWFLIPGDKWEDADWLAELIQITAAELPLPKPKK